VEEANVARLGCDRERELLDAIGAGRWAERCDEELHTHVAGCAGCSDVAAVATALFEDRLTTVHGVAVPRSGLVWWRMQLRARREQERAAARTVSVAHTVALVSAFGVAAAILGVTLLADPGASLPKLASAIRAGALEVSSPSVFASWSGPLLLALAAWLVLAPVAVWLAVTEE